MPEYTYETAEKVELWRTQWFDQSPKVDDPAWYYRCDTLFEAIDALREDSEMGSAAYAVQERETELSDAKISVLEFERKKLMEAVDILYGVLTKELYDQLHTEQPETEQLAQLVHHELWHVSTHEQRMVQA